MRSLMQRAATFLSARGGGNPATPPKTMEDRLQKLVARRRSDAVNKALNSLSDNRGEVISKPLYDDSVYHSADFWMETPVSAEDQPDEEAADEDRPDAA